MPIQGLRLCGPGSQEERLALQLATCLLHSGGHWPETDCKGQGPFSIAQGPAVLARALQYCLGPL